MFGVRDDDVAVGDVAAVVGDGDASSSCRRCARFHRNFPAAGPAVGPAAQSDCHN